EHAQPAILTVSVCVYRVLLETSGLVPAAVCGHSLGEWSALVAAGALDFGDAVRGVRERGRLMQEAVPPGEGAMAAVLGLEAEAVASLCAAAAGTDVLAPANLNGGGQIVVAGHARAAELPSLLVRQVTAPVRWEETVRELARFGARLALEIGPGHVLTGLTKRIEPALAGVPVGDLDGIARARELLA